MQSLHSHPLSYLSSLGLNILYTLGFSYLLGKSENLQLENKLFEDPRSFPILADSVVEKVESMWFIIIKSLAVLIPVTFMLLHRWEE